MLREQVTQIVAGTYQPGTPAFSRAPQGLAELALDLDGLAQLMADREAARVALDREVQHRVRNNLQIMTSLLEMQANRVTSPDAREALNQTRARIGALGVIHRILYESERLGHMAALDMPRMIAELCAQLRLWTTSRPEITLTCNADAMQVPMDMAMPLALFAVEAVTNSFGHAFPEGRGGRISLRFSTHGQGKAALSVRDDGIGFDCRVIRRSTGGELAQGFARQLGGVLVVSSAPDAGTEVRLEFCPGAAVLPDDTVVPSGTANPA